MPPREAYRLGLPPMELAEIGSINTENERARRFKKYYQKLKTVSTVFFIIVAVVTAIILCRYTYYGKKPKTELIISTGSREIPNITIQNTDMDIFLQLKNKTTLTEKREKRQLKKSQKHSTDELVQSLSEEEIISARKLIMNYDKTCEPGNENEMCKNIVQELYKIKTEDREQPFTNMFMKIRGLKEDETDLNPVALGDTKSNIKITKRNTLATTHMGNHRTTPNFDYLGQAGGVGFTPLSYYHSHPHTEPLDHFHRDNHYPPISENCLLARLLQQQYPQGYIDPMHYDPMHVPLAPTGRCPPNNPYCLHAQTRESVEVQERKPHPQDIGIFMRYKTQSPKTTPRTNATSRSADCAQGMVSCISEDKCVMESQICDGIIDCHDVSDEMHCPCKSIIDKSRLCDGYYDCPFGEDEMGCHDCDEISFSCENLDLNSQSNCFSKEQRCNGIRDCANNKDEMECNMLAPSLHEKPIFAVSHTEGFLQRNYRGNWYAVCRNPYMWAHDACLRETGLITRPPYLQMIPIDPLLKITYLNHETGHLMQMSDSCHNSSAIYVVCPALLCGTRVLTTTQLIRENEKYESRLYGRNKRYLCSIYPQSAYCGGRKVRRQSYEKNENEILENIVVGSDGRPKRAEGRVVGGRASQPAAWPWMAALYRDGTFHCGGVVLTQRWVMSAAHCVYQFWEHHYEVQVGMLRRLSYSPQEQNHQVSHVIVNQYYDRLDMKNDLSLLRVKPAIQFSRWIRPICLPGPDTAGPNWLWGPPADTICTTVGWGATFEQGPDPDHMREVEVPIWSKCKHREDRAGKEICAGPTEGGKDACQGDSGGPLLCTNPQNPQQWYIAGIVSHGDGCARKGEPGVYTRVSLFVKWIRYHLNAKSLPTIRPRQECPGFRCVSGITRCISRKKICDKVVDCLNGEDEFNCHYERSTKIDNILVTEDSVQDFANHFPNIFQKERDAAILPDKITPPINMTSVTENLDEAEIINNATTTPLLHFSTNNIQDNLNSKHNTTKITPTTEKVDAAETTSNVITVTPVNSFTSTHDDSNAEIGLDNITPIIEKVDTVITTSTVTNIPTLHSSANNVPHSSNSEQGFINIPSATEKVDVVDTISSMSLLHNSTSNIHNDSSSEQESSEELHNIIESNSKPNDLFDENNSEFDNITEIDIEISSEAPVTGIPNSSLIIQEQDTEANIVVNNNSQTAQSQIDNQSEIKPKSANAEFEKHLSEARRTDVPEDELVPSTTSAVSDNINVTTETINKENITIINKPLINGTSTIPTGNITKDNSTNNFPSDNIDQHIDDNNIDAMDNNDNTIIQVNQKKIVRGQGNRDKKNNETTTDNNTNINNNTIDQEGKDFESPLFDDTISNNLNSLKNKILHGQNNKPLSHKLEPAKIKKVHHEPRHFNCKRISQVIPYAHRCDHKADCEDGTDEFDCTCIDYISTFDSSLLCDGHVDCADGQDENDCYECPSDQFFCKWSQNCLPSEYVCDGIQQCPHGEDELDCYALTNGMNIVCDYDGRPLINLEGYLTKKNGNRWNIVCEDSISLKKQEEAATHTCRYLGFSSANRFLVKYINIKENDIKSVEKFIRKRDAISIPVQFSYKYAHEPEERHIVIKEPQVIKEECVPNITKTCMSLYVYCDHGVYTNFADVNANDILYRSTDIEGKNIMLPWIAKVYVEGDYRCSGVLIELSWVLVSDSCLWDTSLLHQYVTVVLGSYRTLSLTIGPFEQIIHVNAKKKLYNGRLTLLHLNKPANYSAMVKPMITSARYPHVHIKKDMCVAVGQDFNNNTVTVYLQEMQNCKSRARCFKRLENQPSCDLGAIRRQWAAIISCHAEQGWYPAATFVNNIGECEHIETFDAYDIEDYQSEIKRFIHGYNEDPTQTSSERIIRDNCDGERCPRGRCVHYRSVCNGIRDCENGYDESEEACNKKDNLCSNTYHEGCECKVGQLKCKNGLCISKEYFSNGHDDCGDGTDEPMQTTCNQYLARTMPKRLCDGILHCADRTDEDPMFCKCFSKKAYECGSSDECVALDLICDGVADCRNGADEKTCLALRAPKGTVYGTGEVIARTHGQWHTKCYPTATHSRTELEAVCEKLGFKSGHAKQLQHPDNFSLPHTKVVLDQFSQVILNNNASVNLRNTDQPLARVVLDDNLKCNPLFIECL